MLKECVVLFANGGSQVVSDVSGVVSSETRVTIYGAPSDESKTNPSIGEFSWTQLTGYVLVPQLPDKKPSAEVEDKDKIAAARAAAATETETEAE